VTQADAEVRLSEHLAKQWRKGVSRIMQALEAAPWRRLISQTQSDGASRHSRPLWSLVLTAFGGILLALAYAQEPIWWAAWLAPAAILAAALLATRGSRKWLALAAGLIGGATSLPYYATVSESWAIALALVAARAVLWMWMIGVAARAAERWHPAVAVFALPVLLAAAETLIARFSPHGAAGSYAYSQMDALPLVQIASLGGGASLVAVIGLGASALGLGTARKLGWPGGNGAGYAMAIAAAALAGTLAFGLLRLSQAPALAQGREVTLIARDSLGGPPGDAQRFWDNYGPVLDREVQPGRIVVLPEALRILPGAAADALAGKLAQIAAARGAAIVAGFIVDHGGIRTNRAVVAFPDRSIAWYDKQHLVPASEASISPGRSPLVVEIGGVKVGIAICKDMHFPALGRDYGVQGAKLMLVPANDFTVDAWMASRMTALRGVESGFAIARTARRGLMTVSDRYGRILAEQASGPETTVLNARFPAADEEPPTIFARYNWAVDWLSISLAAILLWRMRRSRRREPAA